MARRSQTTATIEVKMTLKPGANLQDVTDCLRKVMTDPPHNYPYDVDTLTVRVKEKVVKYA